MTTEFGIWGESTVGGWRRRRMDIILSAFTLPRSSSDAFARAGSDDFAELDRRASFTNGGNGVMMTVLEGDEELKEASVEPSRPVRQSFDSLMAELDSVVDNQSAVGDGVL